MLVVCVVLLLLFSSSTAQSHRYYISSSTGNDQNPGTQSHPWKSLARLSSVPLLSGDAVFLKRGDTWNVGYGANITVTADAHHPATITSYGNLDDGRPSIVGNHNHHHRAKSSSSSSHCLSLTLGNGKNTASSPGLVISSLECSAVSNGFVYHWGLLGSASLVSIRDCYFHDIAVPDYNPKGGGWGAAILFAYPMDKVSSTAGTLNFQLHHNFANNTDSFFRNFGATINGIASNNTMTHCSFNVFEFVRAGKFALQNSVFYRDTPRLLFDYGTTDVIVGGTPPNSTWIRDNDFVRRGEHPGGPDGCAIDYETNPVAIVTERNNIYASWGAGIMIFGHPGHLPKDVHIRDNLFVRDGCNQTRNDHGEIAFMRLNSTGTITDNTFIPCKGHPIYFYTNPKALDGFKFSGNKKLPASAITDVVAEPKIVVTKNADDGATFVSATTKTQGAKLYYSVDASRPMQETHPLLKHGQQIKLNQTSVFNVKAFKAGKYPSKTAALVVVVKR